MGFLEYIIVTPSHHRVHHAINPIYLDKNYSQIFIFWDKIFGTYQEELKDVSPVYGITRPVQTWNPIKINFQHLWLLIKDAWRTQNLKDKFRIWLMPTGWRPADVAEKYPLQKITDVYHFDKYNPKASIGLHFWCWIQLLFMLGFISYFFGNIATIGSPGLFYYGGFIFLGIYAITDLMDRNSSSIFWESAKNFFGFYLIYAQGNWFGSESFFPGIKMFIMGYFVLSTLVTIYFAMKHYKEDHPKLQLTR
jgi:hypothetical protein